jgi:hypothetical protein
MVGYVNHRMTDFDLLCLIQSGFFSSTLSSQAQHLKVIDKAVSAVFNISCDCPFFSADLWGHTWTIL